MKRLLILAVAAAAGAALYLALRDGYTIAPPASLEESRWEHFDDPEAGWSLQHPGEWRVQVDEHPCPPHSQIVITNVGADLHHPEPEAPPGGFSCTDRWDMRELPEGFAVIELEVPADVHPGPGGSQRSLPLTLEDTFRGAAHPRLGVPRGVWSPVYFDGTHQYFIRAWFGSGASRHDREIAERIVSSIRFDLG